MGDTLAAIRTFLAQCGHPFEVWDCDPQLADTAAFCEHYGVPLENSANTILVRSKTGESRYAACVVLATHRLDVNHTVRKKLSARRVSFASGEETRKITGMEPGGVTPFALPDEVPVWVDAHVFERPYVIFGGGNRESKIKLAPAALRACVRVEVVPGLALASPRDSSG